MMEYLAAKMTREIFFRSWEQKTELNQGKEGNESAAKYCTETVKMRGWLSE